jgi:2'-deoxynucleoside 5'-phosphate N-hydrolase
VLSKLIAALNIYGIEGFIFVDNYKFDETEEQKMMQHAMDDIDNSDILIAETSFKGIGIGVEVGYAKAKGKIIIYLRQKDAEHSTTVSGMSDYVIIYNDEDDLCRQIIDVLVELLSRSS